MVREIQSKRGYFVQETSYELPSTSSTPKSGETVIPAILGVFEVIVFGEAGAGIDRVHIVVMVLHNPSAATISRDL